MNSTADMDHNRETKYVRDSLTIKAITYLIRGILFTSLGMYMVLHPARSRQTLAYYWGTLFEVEGGIHLVFGLIFYFVNRDRVLLCFSICACAALSLAGTIVVLNPLTSTNLFFSFHAVTLLVLGVLQVLLSYDQQSSRDVGIDRSWWWIFLRGMGCLQILLSVYFFSHFESSVNFLVRLTSFFLAIAGVWFLVTFCALMSLRRIIKSGSPSVRGNAAQKSIGTPKIV